nr:MAG TPA: hypothetical protein [Caudoviricetes sp.]
MHKYPKNAKYILVVSIVLFLFLFFLYIFLSFLSLFSSSYLRTRQKNTYQLSQAYTCEWYYESRNVGLTCYGNTKESISIETNTRLKCIFR